ncbi:MAG: heterodisulfide reductase-related iron-sulfur binding cluster, partial [Halobacteriota archaeon]|nr:heterodisulfide reductase-related iron-sulfur binding cluster [Halobacteriota archaeon]
MMTTAAEIFNKAGVDWGILGKNEKCCAGPSLRVGDRDQFKAYAKENIEMIKKSGVKTVVTSCAGCYSTFVKEYPEVVDMGDIEVLHVTEFIAQLIKDKKIEPTKEVPMRVTYHDPCHIGRYVKVYDAPRKILRAVPGVVLAEMVQNRDNSWCCGAGAGMRTALPDVASETGKHRVEQAEDTGAEVLVSACPFCAQNLTDCIKEAGSDLKFMDITEILVKSL